MQKINLTLPILFSILLIGLSILWGSGLGGYLIIMAAGVFFFTILSAVVQERRNRKLEQADVSVRDKETSTVIVAG